jgi:hypothetical protein
MAYSNLKKKLNQIARRHYAPPIGDAAAEVGSTRFSNEKVPDARKASDEVPSNANMSFLPDNCKERFLNRSMSQTIPLLSSLEFPCFIELSTRWLLEDAGTSTSNESRIAITSPPQAQFGTNLRRSVSWNNPRYPCPRMYMKQMLPGVKTSSKR